MKCFIIAQIVGPYNKIIGYRLFDAESSKGEIMDVTVQNITKVISKDPELIKNARLVNGKLSGTNGSLERYAKIDASGNLKQGEKSPLVVLNKIENVGYTVVDFKGQKLKMSNEKAVEYAKNNGIANGKVVTQENIEFISSIADSYEVVKLPTSKLGANNKVNIPIRIGSDAASVAKHTENDIETEMSYNDVFSAMSAEQRSVLKQYYTWYTVDCYKKMAKNVRLNLAPGKAEKLAQLRGIDKWEFAGINDSYLSGNFKAHCELGHRLRYEYFAIPEGILDKDYKVRKNRVRAGLSRTHAQKDAVQELKDSGAIVFGETCAGDFFNISPEDMKKLVKTRKTMSDEIELMSNIITNHLEQSYVNNCKLLYQVIEKLGSTQNVIDAFGENIGYTLLAFIKTNMPFPMSLVIEAASQSRKDIKSFWCKVFPEYKDLIIEMINAKDDANNNSVGIGAGGNLLWYISEYSLEGKYQYDPIGDNEGLRKDIGRYNKETRNLRTAIINSFIVGAGINVKYLDNIETVINYLRVAKFMKELAIKVEKEFYDKQLDKVYKLNKYIKYLENKLYTYGSDNETKIKIDALTNEERALINIFFSSFGFNKTYRTGFYMYIKYSSGYSYCREVTFKKLDILSYITRVTSWKNIKEVAEAIDSISKTPSDIAKLFINYEDKQIKDKLEEEKNKIRYIYILVDDNIIAEKYLDDKLVVAKLDYITYQEFSKDILNFRNNRKYAINTNEINDKSTLLNCSNILSYSEINKEEYDNRLKDIATNRITAQIIRDRERQKQQEEQERLNRLAEEQRLQREHEARLEQENEAKLDKLRELIDKYSGTHDYYGLRTSKAILDTGLKYGALKPKQKWRINKTLEELIELDKNNGEYINYDLDNVINQDKLDMPGINQGDTINKGKTEENTNNQEKLDNTTLNDNKNEKESISDANDNKPKSYVKEDNLKAINDDDAEKAIRCLLQNVVLKNEKDKDIAFSTKIALTINNTGKMSEKQKNFLMKGYSRYLDTRSEGGC